MIKKGDTHDPKGLIFEAYRIDGITLAECRTIFLDWALSLPDAQAPDLSIAAMLEKYESAHDTHPMTQVLREGRGGVAQPRRRGGWRSRNRTQ
ncbi:MAG: hypothetical protein AAF218_05495 [Pseudomonadota bacterium]